MTTAAARVMMMGCSGWGDSEDGRTAWLRCTLTHCAARRGYMARQHRAAPAPRHLAGLVALVLVFRPCTARVLPPATAVRCWVRGTGQPLTAQQREGKYQQGTTTTVQAAR